MEERTGSPLLTLPPPHAVQATGWALEPGGSFLSPHPSPPAPSPGHGSVLGIGNPAGSALTAEGLGAISATASSPRPLRGQEGALPSLLKAPCAPTWLSCCQARGLPHNGPGPSYYLLERPAEERWQVPPYKAPSLCGLGCQPPNSYDPLPHEPHLPIPFCIWEYCVVINPATEVFLAPPLPLSFALE